jgi:hydroxyacylglutathione hydrolase
MHNIVPILAFQDNYIWTLRNDQYAIVVDPGDAVPVIKYLEENKLTLLAILVTHITPRCMGHDEKKSRI